MRKTLMLSAIAATLAGPSLADDSEISNVLMIDTSNGDCMIADGTGEVVLVSGSCDNYADGWDDDDVKEDAIFSQPDESSPTS